jgi:hypothetical protein
VNRLHREAVGHVGAHQCTIPAHDHQRGVQPAFVKGLAHGCDEVLQNRKQRSIQGGGRRPLHRVQPSGKLMSQHDRAAGDPRNRFEDLLFVAGVKGAEIAGDGKGFYLVL